MQFAFRNTYNPDRDLYKYKISIGIDKIKLNLYQETLNEIFRFSTYIEG